MFRPLIPLVILAVLGGSAASEPGDSTAASPKSPDEIIAAIANDPMTFYLAKGEPGACGQGCSEWIAAEGYIDARAPGRLDDLVTSLRNRKPPIFFHSPGGIVGSAINLGIFLRQQGMTAGVSRTIPASCVGASEETCRSSKRSGHALAAELYSVAICHSACVMALVGAKVRQVPPGARLGVHSGKLLQSDSEGRARNFATWRIQYHLRTMQISDELFNVISKVPFEQIRNLSRDEIASFGIDTREFLETRWMAGEPEPTPEPPSTIKLLVEAKGPSRNERRASMIDLACAAPQRVLVSYVRGLGSDEIVATRAIKFVIGDRNIPFSPKASISKIDALDMGGLFDTRSAETPFDLFEAAAARDSIEIIEVDPTNPATPSRTIKLSTDGLSKALEALRKECGPRGTPALK